MPFKDRMQDKQKGTDKTRGAKKATKSQGSRRRTTRSY